FIDTTVVPNAHALSDLQVGRFQDLVIVADNLGFLGKMKPNLVHDASSIVLDENPLHFGGAAKLSNNTLDHHACAIVAGITLSGLGFGQTVPGRILGQDKEPMVHLKTGVRSWLVPEYHGRAGLPLLNLE